MGDKTNSIVGVGGASATEPERLRAQIAETRSDMSTTIEELHGRLNPTVLKDQALDQFHEVASTVKSELKAHFGDAKEAMRAELKEAKETVRSELIDAKTAIQTEVMNGMDVAKAKLDTEIESVKTKLTDEIRQAKSAVREATIGKVENMIHGAQDSMRSAKRSLVDTVSDNPIPSALIGIGLAWLFLGGRRSRQQPAYDGGMYRGGGSARDLGHGENGEQHEGRALHAGRQVVDAATGAASAVGHAVQNAGAAVGHLAQDAGGAIGHLAQDAGGAMGSAAHRVGQTAMDMGHGAADGARRLQSRGGEFYRDNPLAAGAVVLAAGAALGMLIPRTSFENDLIGSVSDDVADRAQHLAHDALAKAGDAAQRLTDGGGAQPQGQEQGEPGKATQPGIQKANKTGGDRPQSGQGTRS